MSHIPIKLVEDEPSGPQERGRAWPESYPLLQIYARNGFFLLLWFFLSTCLNVYNKLVIGDEFDKFPAPLLMTTMHFVIQFACAAMLVCRPGKTSSDDIYNKEPPLSWFHYISKVVPAGMAASLDIGLSNEAMRSFPLSLHTLCKSTGPVFVLIFGILLGLERLNWRLFGAVIVIFAGVGMTVTGGGTVNVVGLSMTLSAAALSGLRWVLTEILLKEKKLGKVDTMFYLSPVMAVFMALFSVATEEWSKLGDTIFFDTSVHALQSVGVMAFGGLIAVCMVGTELKLIQIMSALSMGIAGIMRDLFTIAGAVIIFNRPPLHLRMVFGFIIAILGVGYVNVIRRIDHRKKGVGGKGAVKASEEEKNADASEVQLLLIEHEAKPPVT